MDKFKFEKLIIWQRAMDFGETIDGLANSFPEKEKFNLSSQIRRTADSIALNISEGSIGQTNLEQKKFLGYAIQSLAEVVTCLYKSEKRNYITKPKFNQLYEEGYQLMNMLCIQKERKIIPIHFK
ncbi:four helix bundle protein [Aestuariivivens sp. NBU2969]|uniref:four helix bundle protein n=1 Tax=Aestuariivivens sp. NBU2969 TaxID=2873267 RepID=UPI001CC0EB2F|nr:four helix bundle protein [Aestuariivivens sp. NBU2969]